jgi:hypothetical protein
LFVEGIAAESQNVLEELPESESDFEIIKKESAECDLQVIDFTAEEKLYWKMLNILTYFVSF